MNRRVLAFALSLAVVVLAIWLGWAVRPESGPREPAAHNGNVSPAMRGAEERFDDVPVVDDVDSPTPGSDEPAVPDHADELMPVEDPTGDLGLYERRPMSAVPHRVVRGWGAHGAASVPGFVGAVVVVEPSISDDALLRLARDIRSYHDDATALSIRILDSERAGVYDRHSDGGALLARHLVGLVNRNARLGMDRITIRGREVEP